MKLTPKQERFAVLYVQLGNASAAYRQAYEPKRMSDKCIWEEASKLANHPKVAQRISALQADIAKAAVNTAAYGVDEAMAEAHQAFMLAASLKKPETMVSAIRLKSDLRRLILKQAESGAPGEFALPSDPKERAELLQRIREERKARAAVKLELVKKAG